MIGFDFNPKVGGESFESEVFKIWIEVLAKPHCAERCHLFTEWPKKWKVVTDIVGNNQDMLVFELVWVFTLKKLWKSRLSFEHL